MVAKSYTVAFEGVEAHQVEVQCAVTPGLPAFSIAGIIKLDFLLQHYVVE